jgi:predicted ArsR family transcriptional regulator
MPKRHASSAAADQANRANPASPASPAVLRARALAEPARRRVWEAVRAAPAPVGVAELAKLLMVHPNTIRLHLARLAEAGLVTEEREADRHPGRPGFRYRAAGSDPVSEADAYRRLARLLAQAVRAGTSARDAGRSAGAAEVAGLVGADPVEAIVHALAAEGFEPEVEDITDEGVDVILQTCPFADAAADDPATICQLHLGLAEGAATAIGGLTVESLRINDPYQAGCSLQLRRSTQILRRVEPSDR